MCISSKERSFLGYDSMACYVFAETLHELCNALSPWHIETS